MRKFGFFIVSFLLFAASCNEKAPQKPSYLVDEKKMVEVMVDMHLVETAHNLKLLPPDTTRQAYNGMFERIYVTHQVTKTTFDSSLFYYSTQTEQMNVIYDKILEHLYELESEVSASHSDQ